MSSVIFLINHLSTWTLQWITFCFIPHLWNIQRGKIWLRYGLEILRWLDRWHNERFWKYNLFLIDLDSSFFRIFLKLLYLVRNWKFHLLWNMKICKKRVENLRSFSVFLWIRSISLWWMLAWGSNFQF